MDLKDRVELEFLREMVRRMIEVVDPACDWRADLKASLKATPVDFRVSANPGEDVNEALEAATAEVAARFGFKRADLPTYH